MSFQSSFAIENKRVGYGQPCLIIAEAGVCHFGHLDKAYQLVDLAVEAGADVFKIQHFSTEQLISSVAVEWRDRMRSKELSEEQVLAIQKYCQKKSIIFMATGHDETSLKFLDETIKVPAFKIGSGELGNWPSLRNIASKNKPIILSTGMYSFTDVRQAIEIFESEGVEQLALLHCVTRYPALPQDIHLKSLESLRDMFDGPVGYSDHTVGVAIPLAAVALGAHIIEKHITMDRNVPNAQDWKVACGPENFVDFVKSIREIEKALGKKEKVLSHEELESRHWALKSLTTTQFLPAGTELLREHLTAKRPGIGISPSVLESVLGRSLIVDLPADVPLMEEHLSA